MISLIFALTGIACVVYGTAVLLYAGITSLFHFVWPLMGGICLGIARYEKKRGKEQRKASLPEKGLGILLLLCGVVFVLIEGKIVGSALQVPEDGADVVLVLGCQVRGKRPSKALTERLNAAIGYLERNPQAKVIVTGGKGFGEEITEAEAMQTYLLEQGIAPERIFAEDRSTSTVENVQFAKEFFDPQTDSVVVVTNGFHLYRAERICRKQGLCHVQGLSGKTEAFMAPSYYLREFCAVIKGILLGNM